MERWNSERKSMGESGGQEKAESPGASGRAMEGKLRDAVEKWKLTRINRVFENCKKAVYFAFSEKFGNVVLKINSNGKELSGEHRALKEFEGSIFCKAYDYDRPAGLLLEERILPGTVLRNVAETDRRLEIFAEAFRKIPRGEAKGFGTYLDWLDRAYACCLQGEVPPVIGEYMRRALEIGKEAFEKYPERVLLHGDLHHDNILLDSEGGYKIIDPKGVIGPVIFDLPRFVLNELGERGSKAAAEHIRYVVRRLAEDLGYGRKELEQLFFMEAMLEAAWCLKDGGTLDWEDVHTAALIAQGGHGCREEELQG